MDSFFASVEQQANPALRGRPIAVSGDPKSRTVVAAASKEAKRFRVRSAMTIGNARALCPQIQFVLGDPDKYVEVSRRIIAILESFTPDVEVASIDEAFLDVTGWVERYACAECGAATASRSHSYRPVSTVPSLEVEKKRWATQAKRRAAEEEKWGLQEKLFKIQQAIENNTQKYRGLLDQEETARTKLNALRATSSNT